MTKETGTNQLIEENARLRQHLEMLGRDAANFENLEPDVANVRLKELLLYAEQADEADLLGNEPFSPRFDPMSELSMPDVDDEYNRSLSQLMGRGYVVRPADTMSDEEIEQELERILDKLAEYEVGLAINDAVPDRLAYEYLLSELEEGPGVAPGWVLDGCSGYCEGCFQLPYCDAGKEDYDFQDPDPSIPPQ